MYGFQGVRATSISLGRAGLSLEAVPTRYGPGVRGASGICPERLFSEEKDRGTDPCHGEIDATLNPDTRVLRCIMEASSGLRVARPAVALPQLFPDGPPCRCTAGSSQLLVLSMVLSHLDAQTVFRTAGPFGLSPR